MSEQDQHLRQQRAKWQTPEHGDVSKIEVSVASPEEEAGIWEVQYKTSLAALPNAELGITVDDIVQKGCTNSAAFLLELKLSNV